MTIPATPGIPDVIGRCDQLAQSQPINVEHGYDRPLHAWIIAAHQALEDAADLIEALALERDQHQQRVHTAETIFDRIYPHLTNTVHHIEHCDADNHPYPRVMFLAGGCHACETLSIIRYWQDDPNPPLNNQEIENAIPNTQHL